MTGEEIRARRKALHLSQTELAAKLGVTLNTVARWERSELTIGSAGAIGLALDALHHQNQERLIKARARLKALRSHVPNSRYVRYRYVQEFHSILDELGETSSCDLADFMIPEDDCSYTGNTYRIEDLYCERSFLLMRVDGVLAYFVLKASHKRARIGFKPSSS
jgi:transcriptional regulator with XRE-family HTH domain